MLVKRRWKHFRKYLSVRALSSRKCENFDAELSKDHAMFHSTRMGESEIVRKKKPRYFERDLFVEKLSKKISKLPFFFVIQF